MVDNTQYDPLERAAQPPQLTPAAEALLRNAAALIALHGHPSRGRAALLYLLSRDIHGGTLLEARAYHPQAIACACYVYLGEQHGRSLEPASGKDVDSIVQLAGELAR